MPLFVCLYVMADVRAITPSRCGFNRPSCAIISSVRPSLKYSCSASPLKFSNGRTASMTRRATDDAGGDSSSTDARKRYPRRGTVSMNPGVSASSQSAARIWRMQ